MSVVQDHASQLLGSNGEYRDFTDMAVKIPRFNTEIAQLVIAQNTQIKARSLYKCPCGVMLLATSTEDMAEVECPNKCTRKYPYSTWQVPSMKLEYLSVD